MKPGGLLIYLLMCPIMVWAGLFALTAAFLLIYSGDYAALGGQIAIAVACGQKSTIGGTVGAPAGDLLGRSGTTLAGAITAALFLKEFVKKTPWAHIDIAGPVWGKEGGATGYGVKLLSQWVLSHDK